MSRTSLLTDVIILVTPHYGLHFSRYSLPDTTFAVPSSVKTKELNTLVNQLLCGMTAIKYPVPLIYFRITFNFYLLILVYIIYVYLFHFLKLLIITFNKSAL